MESHKTDDENNRDNVHNFDDMSGLVFPLLDKNLMDGRGGQFGRDAGVTFAARLNEIGRIDRRIRILAGKDLMYAMAGGTVGHKKVTSLAL